MADEATQPKRKKRVRNFTPNDRAQHRILEKERREAFNGRMMELARLLPRIASVRNLSKHIIVRESIRQHTASTKERAAITQGVRSLLAERDDLLSEVNRWRAHNAGPRPFAPRGPANLDQALSRLFTPAHHASPSFTSSSGNFDELDEDDDDDDASADTGTLPRPPTSSEAASSTAYAPTLLHSSACASFTPFIMGPPATELVSPTIIPYQNPIVIPNDSPDPSMISPASFPDPWMTTDPGALSMSYSDSPAFEALNWNKNMVPAFDTFPMSMQGSLPQNFRHPPHDQSSQP